MTVEQRARLALRVKEEHERPTKNDVVKEMIRMYEEREKDE
jgi:hypothetical protein